MKIYNAAYTIAFSVLTNTPRAPTQLEVIDALLKRIVELTEDDAWQDALGEPFDVYREDGEPYDL